MGKDTGAIQSASLVQSLSEKPLLICFGTHHGSALRRNRALQPLCHEHHLEMRLTQVPLQTGSEPSQTLVYACPEPDCLVHYNSSRGYFALLHNGNGIDRDMMPQLVCLQDGPLESSFPVPRPLDGLHFRSCGLRSVHPSANR